MDNLFFIYNCLIKLMIFLTIKKRIIGITMVDPRPRRTTVSEFVLITAGKKIPM